MGESVTEDIDQLSVSEIRSQNEELRKTLEMRNQSEKVEATLDEQMLPNLQTIQTIKIGILKQMIYGWLNLYLMVRNMSQNLTFHAETLGKNF